MESWDYLMSGSVQAAPQSYVTSSLKIIRRISQAFAVIHGEFKFSPIKVVNQDGKRYGYGLAFWRIDKNGKNQLCLFSKTSVHETAKRFEKSRGNGRKTLEWWLIGTDDVKKMTAEQALNAR